MNEEKRITNREYMTNLLKDPDWLDDGWASYEAMVYYNIGCPYFVGDERARCYGKKGDFINRENCYFCKHEWLDKEVDE